jgi:hypothetical protein
VAAFDTAATAVELQPGIVHIDPEDAGATEDAPVAVDDHAAVNPSSVPLPSEVNLNSRLVPDDCTFYGILLPDQPFSLTVELVEVPS